MRKPCCDKQDKNKGAWSKQEDEKLIDYVTTHGEGCWRSLPQAAGLLRCGKSCRLRWINYLRPDLKRGNFTEDEEELIIKLHALLGNRWSLIAGRLPGRTDNEVKNYWNSNLRRKLLKKGIDPKNHRLGRRLPTFRQPQAVSDTATSSESKSQVCQPWKQEETSHGDDNDRVSDAASCLDDDDHRCLLPDLNLDLTISLPSPTFSPSLQMRKQIEQSSSSKEIDTLVSPTLLFFV